MLRRALRYLLAAFVIGAGVMHFVSPATFVAMIPPALPAPLALVYLSGVAEIAGGLGLLWAPTRRAAAWGLVALFVAVFPANVYMAVAGVPLGDRVVAPWLLWARLPLQAVFIAWALAVRHDPRRPAAPA